MIWTIDGHNSGYLDNGVVFSGVGNLVGGSAADDFVFDSGGSLSGNIDGKDGGNALDFTADPGQGIVLTAEGAIGGFDGTDTNTSTLAGQFSNISEIVGSSVPSEDGLSGLNTAATWVVTPATSTYTVNADGRTLSFLGFGILNGIAGGSTFDVQGTGFPLTINGNAGSDVFDVSSSAGSDAVGNLNAIGGTLTINAGPGRANRLILDDTTDGTAHANVVITSGAVRNLAPSEIDYTAAGGGSFDDATAGDGLLIQGPALGSTFNVQGTLGGSTTEIVGGGGNDAFNVGNAANSLGDIAGTLTLDGSGYDPTQTTTLTSGEFSNTLPTGNALSFNDQGDATANLGYTLTSSTLDRTGIPTITYKNFQTVTLNGGSAGNSIDVKSTAASVNTNVHGGDGVDEVTVEGTGDSSNVTVSTGASPDTINLQGTGTGSITLG